jgi:hypothetical protein
MKYSAEVVDNFFVNLVTKISLGVNNLTIAVYESLPVTVNTICRHLINSLWKNSTFVATVTDLSYLVVFRKKLRPHYLNIAA